MEKANEVRAAVLDETAQFDDRRHFVENLGWLLNQTRERVVSCKLRDDDVVVVRFKGGREELVNVACDSYAAIIRDVMKIIS